jgi:hypothetical protein
MLTIDRAGNGYILTVTEKDEFGEVVKTAKYVYTDDDGSCNPQADAAYGLLWNIVDELGVGGSRYDPKRLRVVWEAGDKHEGE